MTGRPEIELVSWVVTDDSTATVTHPNHCWAWWEAVARLERTVSPQTRINDTTHDRGATLRQGCDR